MTCPSSRLGWVGAPGKVEKHPGAQPEGGVAISKVRLELHQKPKQESKEKTVTLLLEETFFNIDIHHAVIYYLFSNKYYNSCELEHISSVRETLNNYVY